MVRTQVQLPDVLYAEAKKIAERQEVSMAELVRRGLEHVIQLYPPEVKSDDRWELPGPRSLGDFLAPQEDWRELANTVESARE